MWGEKILQSSAPIPVARASPRSQRQSEKQRKYLTDHSAGANFAPTTWPGSSVLKLPAPESAVALWWSYSCLKSLDKKLQGSKVSLPQWLQVCTLVNTETTQCLLYSPLPPTSWFPLFPPPYLIPFVNSVRYWRQGLSLPLCLHRALHGGWQLECHYNQRMSMGEDLRH